MANRLVPGSYVSCQAALTHRYLIPEFTPVITSVCTGRPGRRDTPLVRCQFRHLGARLLYGYQWVDLGDGQQAFVASPEKALLDLVHLQPGAEGIAYLRELRLQNLHLLDAGELQRLAVPSGCSGFSRLGDQTAHSRLSEKSVPTELVIETPHRAPGRVLPGTSVSAHPHWLHLHPY